MSGVIGHMGLKVGSYYPQVYSISFDKGINEFIATYVMGIYVFSASSRATIPRIQGFGYYNIIKIAEVGPMLALVFPNEIQLFNRDIFVTAIPIMMQPNFAIVPLPHETNPALNKIYYINGNQVAFISDAGGIQVFEFNYCDHLIINSDYSSQDNKYKSYYIHNDELYRVTFNFGTNKLHSSVFKYLKLMLLNDSLKVYKSGSKHIWVIGSIAFIEEGKDPIGAIAYGQSLLVVQFANTHHAHSPGCPVRESILGGSAPVFSNELLK